MNKNFLGPLVGIYISIYFACLQIKRITSLTVLLYGMSLHLQNQQRDTKLRLSIGNPYYETVKLHWNGHFFASRSSF